MSTTPVEVALRQHQADENRVVRIAPDFTEPEDLREVVGAELVQPLADLFSTRDQIRMFREAFKNAVNEPKALEWLLADIAKVERALRRRWEAS